MTTRRDTQADKDRSLVDVAKGTELWLCCPVAQSLKRRGFRFVEVDVSVKWRHQYPDGSHGPFLKVPLPDEAVRWIAAYDAGEDPPPFQFELGAEP